MKFNHPILLVIKKSTLNYRYAFTLVELLVAMALIIFMLSIMSQAFVIATTAMSGLKKVTDLVDKVRPVLATLEKDLGSYHFEGSKRLSDPDFWSAGPPSQGYFMVWQDKPNSNHYPANITPKDPNNNYATNPTYSEGNKDGLLYGLSGSDANHMIAFTTKVAKDPTLISPEDYYGINIPYAGDFADINLPSSLNATGVPVNSNFGYDLANIYFPNGANKIPGNQLLNFKNQSLSNKGINGSTRVEKLLTDWAEVAYFIRDTGRKTDNGVPICTLYRQQRFLLPEASLVNNASYYLNIPVVGDPKFNLRYTDYIYNISHFSNNDDGVRTGLANRPNLPVSSGRDFVYWNQNWPIKFNTPETLTVPWRRIGNRPYCHAGVLDTTSGKDIFVPYDKQLANNSNHPGAYSDVLLDNVISFDVRLMVDNSLDYRSLWEVAGIDARNVQTEIQNGFTSASYASYPERYPGPDSPSDWSVIFTDMPYSVFGNTNKLFRGYGYTRYGSGFASLPFRLRDYPPVAPGKEYERPKYKEFDRVVFDTWSSFHTNDSWSTSVTSVGGTLIETELPNFIYPKPYKVSPGADPYYRSNGGVQEAVQPLFYDSGVELPATAFNANPNILYHGVNISFDHDSDPSTSDILVKGDLEHPFYGKITNASRLQEILDKHKPYSWMPSPGLGPDRIPLWQNSYVQAVTVSPSPAIVPIYFPKGPIIKAIQISIRIYDESTKTAKEFKLIQRL